MLHAYLFVVTEFDIDDMDPTMEEKWEEHALVHGPLFRRTRHVFAESLGFSDLHGSDIIAYDSE